MPGDKILNPAQGWACAEFGTGCSWCRGQDVVTGLGADPGDGERSLPQALATDRKLTPIVAPLYLFFFFFLLLLVFFPVKMAL